MATAYQSGLLNDYFRRSSQRRALTGLPVSYQEQRGLLDPILAYDAEKTKQAGLLAQHRSQFDRQMQLQEKVSKDQATAGMVGGVSQLATLPLAYQSAKNLGWIGGTKTIAPAAVGPTGGTGLLSSTAPVATGTTAQGSVGAAGTLGGAQMGAAAYPGVAGGTATAGQLGEMSAVGAGESAAVPGLLGTAGTVAGPAALGAGAGMWGMGKLMGVGGPGHQGGEVHTANVLGGIAGGAAAGAAATSWSGPGAIVGGIIGGIIGGISSLF